MAVQIPRRRANRAIPEIRVLNPGKGLNNFAAPQLIGDQEGSAMKNIRISESGCVSKAYGFSAVGTGLSSNPKGLGALYTSSVRQLLTVDGTSLKYLNGTSWTSISGASFTASQETNFTQCRDAIYVWNGSDAGAKYDGSTLSRPTTTISASFSIFYSGYQIASGVSTQPNRLYISSVTNADDFTNATGTGGLTYDGTTHPGASTFAGTDANYVDVNKGDGDKITGFSKFQSALIIFKERSIYQLTFDSSGVPTVSLITGTRGAVGHKSIDTVDNDVFFLSRSGVFVLGNEPNYNAAIRTNELTARVKTTIDTISGPNLAKCAALFSDSVYHLAIPSGGTTSNNAVLTYDKRYLAWSYWDHIHANAWVEFIDSSNVRHLYYAADDEAKVYEVVQAQYNSAGSAISAYWESKVFDAGVYDIYKRWVDVTLLFRQVVGSVTIKIYTDNGSLLKTSTITSSTDSTGSLGQKGLGTQILGGTGNASTGVVSSNNIPYRIKINTKSRTIKIRVENSMTDQTFTLLGFVITYRPYSHFGFDSQYKIY